MLTWEPGKGLSFLDFPHEIRYQHAYLDTFLKLGVGIFPARSERIAERVQLLFNQGPLHDLLFIPIFRSCHFVKPL